MRRSDLPTSRFYEVGALFLALFILFLHWPNVGAFLQEKGGRDPGPSIGTPKVPKAPKTGPRIAPKGGSKGTTTTPKPKFANITITVTPTDSTVWLNDQQMANAGSQLTGIKPGPYTLTVRHLGYRDQQRSVELKPGENDLITITMEPLKGTLSVKPSVDGASIDVRSIDRNQSTGIYAGGVDNVDFPPGEYEVTVSKLGYQATTRTFTIKPGGLVALEPRLDPLPTPTPTPQTTIPTSSTVEIDGRYLILSLRGTSGDVSRRIGTINVTTSRTSPSAYVKGSLNGSPCQVSFVPLENVAEWSLIENPSPSNNWALIVVRVRLKDSKQPISFAVNWAAIQNSSDNLIGSPKEPPDVVSRAVMVDKASPAYPQSARSSRTSGTVNVSVLIDEQGRVKSAKAMDGPLMLRQSAENAARQCRFKPAMRNGVATQSTETISFVFQLN